MFFWPKSAKMNLIKLCSPALYPEHLSPTPCPLACPHEMHGGQIGRCFMKQSKCPEPVRPGFGEARFEQPRFQNVQWSACSFGWYSARNGKLSRFYDTKPKTSHCPQQTTNKTGKDRVTWLVPLLINVGNDAGGYGVYDARRLYSCQQPPHSERM